MAYEIRPLATLASQARQFFTQAVPGAVVRLWANTFTVLGKVLALLDFEHEMRRQFLFNQLFASTAEYEWLTRHGFELGLTPDAGDSARGTITVPAIAGLLIPASVQFARADGATYSTLAPTTATSTSVDLLVQADAAGIAYDVDAGDSLFLVVATGVPEALGATATVDAGGITGGLDPEDLETFRARVLYRKRNPPQGGSASDYVQWVGEALATAKAVYVDSFANDSRSVWVCFTVSDQPNNIPTDAEVAIVQAYVSDTVRRPITARVFATAPTPVPVAIALTNFAPDTPDTRAAVAVEIAALQADEMEPATPSTPFVLYTEAIASAVKRATGVSHFTLVSPAADIPFVTGGQMPVLQEPTYS
ncbi:baseplate J/gp47 family protein [Lichenihabitans sp. PAMC28606]|uniref:baseplate J/gp47 family protein n=1 Tax=Lichenihabitans sp. PAMC28606 TaxID=2880932 RepID=UPI001D0B6923|nr:baseplate J/gp47 family protein [Lichenihabitans sp. PAMC28606]UDL95514.1 baseplate J/gp47 family protein [Lichenihabitans sp. PAMC28606]